ncbi:MAG: hypothetical protein FJ137_17900 [Deltaproteobacteria bacterium]|nr:hypothetical protein [Deltaproteobacteria bacterium]
MRGGLARWAQLRGRSALVVVGALDGGTARAFAARVVAGDVLPMPVDATDAGRADVLVIIGRVSPRLAPVLVATRQRLAAGAVVLAFDTDDDAGPAVPADAVIDVDVVVRGAPPGDAALTAALDALRVAFTRADAAGPQAPPATVPDDPGAAP